MSLVQDSQKCSIETLFQTDTLCEQIWDLVEQSGKTRDKFQQNGFSFLFDKVEFFFHTTPLDVMSFLQAMTSTSLKLILILSIHYYNEF